MADPGLYTRAIRSGITLWYTVDATLGGAPVAGATGLRPAGGQITDTLAPGVRRTLTLELPPAPGMFDRLAPIGTTLTVTCHVRYPNRQTVDIPMGVFDVDSERMTEGEGGVTITAPDRWALIQRARFIRPQASIRGASVRAQIASLLGGAVGGMALTDTATADETMPALVWPDDRAKAVLDLADSIAAWVSFDRAGAATLTDAPTVGRYTDWIIDASASGVLTSLDRERSRTDTRNVIVVSSSASGGERFAPVYVWDTDPASPTYAGTNPQTNPGSAGPFGIVPDTVDTPIAKTQAAAKVVGYRELYRRMGLASQVSLGSVPNPAIDAGDVIDVVPPRERYDIPRGVERHIVDTVTHPLAPGTAQHIDGRATRHDDLT